MFKSLKTIMVVLLLLTTSLVFGACGPKDEFKVTIKDGNTVVDTLDELPSQNSLSKYDKQGYILEGIYIDAEFEEKFDAKTYGELQMDTTLYLKYEKKSYYVTFNANGGSSIEPYTVVYDTAYSLPVPVREGYIFKGYTLDGEEFPLEGTYNKTSSVKVFANWEIAKYSVKFINASATPNAQIGEVLTVDHGSKVTAPQMEVGYQIENGKVYTDKECTTEFDFNTQIKANTDLYLKIVPINYVVTINANGGEAVAPQTIAYNSNYTLPTPVREGYNFTGYTIDGISFAQSGIYNKNSNITVTATWEIKSFDVKFLNVGKTPYEQIGETVSINYNGKVSMVSFSTAGYEILNGKAYKDEALTQEFNFATETIKANTNIYLKVIASTFNITVNQATGVNTTAVYGETYTLSEPTREGFEFKGYTLNGQPFALEGVYTYTTDIIITANWEAVEGYYDREVYFYDGNRELEDLTRSVKVGDIVYVNGLPTPSKDGYDFDAWYLDSGLVNKATENITVADDISLYAKFNAKIYSITINANGGEIVNPQTIAYNSNYSLPTPVREGYNFTGYTIDGVEFAQSGIYTKTTNITVVANWEIKTFEVKFINVDTNGQIGETLTIEYNNRVSGLPTIETVGSEILNGKAYLDAELTQEFSFNTQITANTTLYIKIVKSVYTITVDTDGGSSVAAKQIEYNGQYNLEIPTKNGYKFVKYIIDGTDNSFALNGTYELTFSIKVIAVWEELDVEVGENSTSDEYNIFVVDNKYFKEKKVYDSDETEYNYVFLKGSSINFNDMTISSKDAGNLATIENGNRIIINNLTGTFTLTITKTVDSTVVTYNRTAVIVENVAVFDYGMQYTGRDENNFNTKTLVETLSVGIDNFIPELTVKNRNNVDLNFEQSNLSVVVKATNGDIIDNAYQHNAAFTGFNFDNGLLNGEYQLIIRPKYCLEDKTVVLNVKFNNGKNVYTNKELKEYFANHNVSEINILRDIVAELDDNQYIDGIKNKGPYPEESLVIENNQVNYEKSTTGNVYYRHLINKNDNNLTVHGNSFKIDASKLPRVDAIQNNTWVTFADQTFSMGKVANHHAMLFSFESLDANLNPRNGNNSLVIDNLAIFGNNTKDAGESEVYNSGNDSYYTMSASYNAVRISGGNLNCDNVSVRNSLIAMFISGGYEKDASTGELSYATTAKLNNLYLDNSWANSICAFDLVDLDISNSKIIHSGGAAVHYEIYPNEEVSFKSKLTIDANTSIENWVIGTESWFAAYHMDQASLAIKTQVNGGLTDLDAILGLYEQPILRCSKDVGGNEVFNFAIFYQQAGDMEDWIGNDNCGIITNLTIPVVGMDRIGQYPLPEEAYYQGNILTNGSIKLLGFETEYMGVKLGAYLPLVEI